MGEEDAKAPSRVWSHEGEFESCKPTRRWQLLPIPAPFRGSHPLSPVQVTLLWDHQQEAHAGAAERSLKSQLLAKQTGTWLSWCRGQTGRDLH